MDAATPKSSMCDAHRAFPGLPNEVALNIFQDLEPNETLQLQRVSKTWQSMLKSPIDLRRKLARYDHFSDGMKLSCEIEGKDEQTVLTKKLEVIHRFSTGQPVSAFSIPLACRLKNTHALLSGDILAYGPDDANIIRIRNLRTGERIPAPTPPVQEHGCIKSLLWLDSNYLFLQQDHQLLHAVDVKTGQCKSIPVELEFPDEVSVNVVGNMLTLHDGRADMDSSIIVWDPARDVSSRLSFPPVDAQISAQLGGETPTSTMIATVPRPASMTAGLLIMCELTQDSDKYWKAFVVDIVDLEPIPDGFRVTQVEVHAVQSADAKNAKAVDRLPDMVMHHLVGIEQTSDLVFDYRSTDNCCSINTDQHTFKSSPNLTGMPSDYGVFSWHGVHYKTCRPTGTARKVATGIHRDASPTSIEPSFHLENLISGHLPKGDWKRQLFGEIDNHWGGKKAFITGNSLFIVEVHNRVLTVLSFDPDLRINAASFGYYEAKYECIRYLFQEK